MIAKAMKRFATAQYTPSYLDTFKRTIVVFTIDFLKAVNLYRVNRGILAVACVEHLLYPNKHVKEYIKVYRCNDSKARKVYKKLCGLPDNAQLDDAIIKSARSFFKCPTFLKKTSCLDKIRSYLRSIVIDDEEMRFIRKASIQVITGNEDIDVDELPENVVDPIEVQPPTSPIIPLDPVKRIEDLKFYSQCSYNYNLELLNDEAETRVIEIIKTHKKCIKLTTVSTFSTLARRRYAIVKLFGDTFPLYPRPSTRCDTIEGLACRESYSKIAMKMSFIQAHNLYTNPPAHARMNSLSAHAHGTIVGLRMRIGKSPAHAHSTHFRACAWHYSRPAAHAHRPN
ncbi:unnamed protein product, partial [Trichogramma brassicae]